MTYHAVTGEGDGYVLDEDERKLEAIGDFAEIIAEVAFNVMEDHVDAAYALLTHDHEELSEFGAEYLVVAEYLVEILDAVRQEILNASAGELGHAAGWVTGRITGEIAMEVGSALATGGGSVAVRAGRIGAAVAKIGTKFRGLANVVPDIPGLSPQLMHTVADKVEDMADYLGAMATTKMCFVAGTPVQAIQGAIPIEQIRPGDLVLSRDEQTGSMGYMPVVQTFETHPSELYAIKYKARGLQRAGDEVRSLTGTGDHPFFVMDTDSFVPMRELKIGDRLLLDDGISAAHVVDIQVQRGPPAGGYTTYNFEVAAWHTYFVGGTVSGGGVWVHNRGPACQRAFSIVTRIKNDFPGMSHWDAFEQFLWRTATGRRRDATDPAMSGVVRLLMETTYTDAILPDGTVDLTKVRSVSEIRAFRNLPVAQDRLPGELLHNHHIVPQEWAKVLYKQIHGTEPTQAWLDSMPGWLMEIREHVPDGYGSANFHDILKRRMADIDIDIENPGDANAILDAIGAAYDEWDPENGSKIWVVAKTWLQGEGIQ